MKKLPLDRCTLDEVAASIPMHLPNGRASMDALNALDISAQRLRDLTLDMDHLALDDVPGPAFIVPEWLPAGYVTLLAAHGEAGKSQVALYVAICLATGLPLFGQPAGEQRKVLVYSAEDREPVLQYRVQRYCRALDIHPAALKGWLFVVDAGALADPELYVERRGDAVGNLTLAYEEVRRYMADDGISIVFIDNASDVYAASEISRPAVRGFVRSLQHLLPLPNEGAILLLGHVNRAASSNHATGQQYSGSTAWHNSVRSRWELSRNKDKDNGDEDTDDEPVPISTPYKLRRVKGNYAAPAAGVITLHWNHRFGVILPDVEPGPVVQGIEQRNLETAILRALAEAEEQGLRVSTEPSARNNAARTLTGLAPGMPSNIKMKSMTRALGSLKARGLVKVGQYTLSNRSTGHVWELTDDGRAEARR